MRELKKVFLLSMGLLWLSLPAWSQEGDEKVSETIGINQLIIAGNDIISPTDFISSYSLLRNSSLKSKGGCHDDQSHDDGGCGGGCDGGHEDGGCQKLGHLAIVSLTGSNNQAYVDQKGNGNSTTWFQEGNNNYFDLSQRGRQNVHEGSLSGEDNLIKVLQRGKGNYIRQELVGNDMDLEIVQKGHNHEFIQIETANNSPAYKVHQQGNHGMKIIVEHSRF